MHVSRADSEWSHQHVSWNRWRTGGCCLAGCHLSFRSTSPSEHYYMWVHRLTDCTSQTLTLPFEKVNMPSCLPQGDGLLPWALLIVRVFLRTSSTYYRLTNLECRPFLVQHFQCILRSKTRSPALRRPKWLWSYRSLRTHIWWLDHPQRFRTTICCV